MKKYILIIAILGIGYGTWYYFTQSCTEEATATTDSTKVDTTVTELLPDTQVPDTTKSDTTKNND